MSEEAKNKIHVSERDATALAEAIRIARETTGSAQFRQELADILDRLTPPAVRFAIRINNNPEDWMYWTSGIKHGTGWRSKIDSSTTWDVEQLPAQMRAIRGLCGNIEVTLVPVE